MNRVRALFVNSGMLGHASVASLIADAIARDPGIDATHISLAEPNGRRRAPRSRGDVCATARTDEPGSRTMAERDAQRARRVQAAPPGDGIRNGPGGRPALSHAGHRVRQPRTHGRRLLPSSRSTSRSRSHRSRRPEALRAHVSAERRARRRASSAARSAIVATSRWAADDLKRVYPDVRRQADRAAVPGPPRESSIGNSIELRRRRAEDEPVRFLFVGGDFMRKGGPDLLRAWQEGGFAPPHRLTLVTDWPRGRPPSAPGSRDRTAA